MADCFVVVFGCFGVVVWLVWLFFGGECCVGLFGVFVFVLVMCVIVGVFCGVGGWGVGGGGGGGGGVGGGGLELFHCIPFLL